MKWEYCTEVKNLVHTEVEWENDLNYLGRQGWELICVTAESPSANRIAYFKRALKK